jgi:hypothetical protein
LEVADTNAIKLGAAYVSSGIPGANHAAFASNAMFNGSYWVIPNSTTISQMLQYYGGATYFMQTQTPGAADWQIRMTIGSNGDVGIGTNNPQHTLQVAGTIGAEEVLVTPTGADYVFEPGYRLQPLNEVAKYIEANHHLPDIPSADEVKQKGMGVGQMETKLLAKVEELTLHMIRQEQENQELRGRIAQLEKTTATPGAIPVIGK